SSRRRHTRSKRDWSSDVCSSDLKLRRVPSLIHESDMTPGLANKLSIPFAKKVLATFPETTKHLPEKKAVYVGAVVRKALFNGDKERGKKMIDYQNKDDKQVLL